MKIVIAPQGFKGTMSCFSVASAIQEGAKRVFPQAEYILMPVADGGDDTLNVLVRALSGKINETRATGSQSEAILAPWGAVGKTAVIEMARICGLAMTPIEDRKPLRATTYGVGEVILAALNAGFRQFVIGIGGSATNDGGAGMAQALGARLLDWHGKDLPRGGAALSKLSHIEIDGMDPRIKECNFQIACDVLNPLTGPEGASVIYSPQKGASPMDVEVLEEALLHYSTIVKHNLGVDIYSLPGAGAAGGTGGGMAAFLNAKLVAGSDFILSLLHFDKALQGANLVITGEGRMDRQTVYNKAPIAVAHAAKRHNIPVIAIVGSVGEGYEAVHQHGIDAVIPLSFFPSAPKPDSRQLVITATEEALRCSKTVMG